MAEWEKQKKSLKIVNFIGKTQKIIVAEGDDINYHAHPTSLILDDNKTIFAVWNTGHGGNAGPIA